MGVTFGSGILPGGGGGASLPDQSSSAGLFLYTDGVTASWRDPLPSLSGSNDKVLTSTGVGIEWRLPTRLRDVTVHADDKNPATLIQADSSKVLTNEGATAGVFFNLPATIVTGMYYTFHVQAAQVITVTAGTGDTIRLGANVTPAAGSITCGVVGSTVTLFAINTTEWVALDYIGPWGF